MLQTLEFCKGHVCKLMSMADRTLVTLSIHGKLLHSLVDVKEDYGISEEVVDRAHGVLCSRLGDSVCCIRKYHGDG